MKQLKFFSSLAIASMLFATSCSQEEIVNEVANGDYVDATFTLNTADGIASRATIGDGTTVDKVACSVYDANGVELDWYQIVPVNSKKATYNVRLAKGQDYRIAFFAYNEAAAAYNVKDLKNVKVLDEQKSNLEGRDAFTAYFDVTADMTMNAIDETVNLYRPFAQLNLGIDDAELEDAKKAGIVVNESYIKVSNVYKAFSAYDDAVVTTDVAGSMEFALNTIPTQKLSVDVNKDGNIDSATEEYNYLALNYLLVGDKKSEKSLTDVEFVWTTEDGKTNNPSTNFINIPVQRNYRTNIIGKLLTNPATFNIVIEEGFENSPKGDYIVTEDGTVIANVSTLAALQAALDNAKANNKTIINLTAKITGDAKITEKDGASILIDGCDNEYDGQFRIYGQSTYADATTIFKNIKFTPTTDKYSIYGNEDTTNKEATRYIDNVIIENCSFTAAAGSEAYHVAGSIYFKAADSVEVSNCTATNMHSIVGAESGKGTFTVDKVETINCKNSVSFNNTPKAYISNSVLESVGEDGYGVRVKGEIPGYGVVIEDCNINAVVPVLVRNMTANSYSIDLKGENTLTTTKGYQVVISNIDYSINKTTGEWEKLTTPTGTYTLNGGDDFIVYPEDIAVLPTASTAAQNGQLLVDAIKSAPEGADVYVADGEYYLLDNSNNDFHKSFSLIGMGNNAVINVNKKGLKLSGAEGNESVVNVRNITINSETQAVYAKEYVTVNLYDVTCKTDGNVAILIDTANPGKDGVKSTVNAYNVTIDNGDTVEFCALPCTTVNAPNCVSYTYFNYEGGNIGVCKPQSIALSTGSNMFVNGVALPAHQ